MALPEYFKEELKQRCEIGEIISSYVILKRRGKNLVGLCPFHNEKTPSFVVYPENGSFYCFGCNTGGDVISFVERVENLDYIEAVRFLAQRAGLAVPEDGVDDTMSKLRTRILEINREAARFFYRTLTQPEGRPGLEYLKRRGLDAQTIKHFGLGYAPDSGYALASCLKAKGYTSNEMVQSDMVRLSKNNRPYDRYRGHVMYPIFDLRGNVVAFGGRILTDEKPKYINTADTPVYHKSSGLFAMNFAKNAGTRQLILAEGYMDVIALHRAGFQNSIASLGTALTTEQANIIRRYADEVVICYDSDEAGQRATQRAIPILKKAGLSIRVITVPGNKDPDEFMRSFGKDGPLRFKALLEESGNDLEYRLRKVRDKYDIETDDGRVKYLQEAAEVVGFIDDKIAQDVYAGKLSRETGVSKEAILSMAEKAASRAAKQRKKEEIRSQQRVVGTESQVNPEKARHTKAAFAEENIIAYLFDHPDRSDALRREIPPEKFVTAWNRRVYETLLGKTIHGAVSISDFSEALSKDEMSELTRIIVQHRDAPPGWVDVQKSIGLIQTDGSNIKNASDEDVLKYMQQLRDQKNGGNE